MSDGFEVDLDTLHRHATRVQAVADDLATAQSAARTTNLFSGAFGLMCAFVPAAVMGTDMSARSAIAAVLTTTRETATEIRAMAAAYQAVDREVADTMKALERALP